MSEKNSYKNIIRSSSLFGIVQVAHILIAIIRSKALALLIGPAGYGIFGLLNSTTDLIRMGTGFGLETSSVKIISESAQDPAALRRKASLIIRLTVFTGTLGTIIAVIFSKYFSLLTFGDSGKTLAIALIAVSVFFQQVANGQIAVMQGTQKLNLLAKANLLGNLAGLLITLPLYFVYGFDAIVPSIIIAAVLNCIVSRYFYNKLNLGYSGGNFRNTLVQGRDMLYFGAMLSISSFLPIFSNYVIQVFISNTSTIATVGLFTIGMALINSYVGILFTAMSAEYYPRLASIHNNRDEVGEAVNRQSVIAMLAIVPIIIFFLGYSSFIIRLLFSEKFNSVVPMLLWGVTAMFFKAVSFSMGYVIIARGDSKIFIKTSIMFNAIYLTLLTGGFYLYGLEGIGVGLLVYYAIHLTGMAAITTLRYRLHIDAEVVKVFITGFILCAIGITISNFYIYNYKEFLFACLLAVSMIYSFYEIDKRIHLKTIFKDYLNRGK
ncbi:MAG: oligosaccharide flippase family protein [Flavobacterium sp.]